MHLSAPENKFPLIRASFLKTFPVFFLAVSIPNFASSFVIKIFSSQCYPNFTAHFRFRRFSVFVGLSVPTGGVRAKSTVFPTFLFCFQKMSRGRPPKLGEPSWEESPDWTLDKYRKHPRQKEKKRKRLYNKRRRFANLKVICLFDFI